MGIVLPRGLAFQPWADGIDSRQQGGIDDVGCGPRAAITGVDQLQRAGGRDESDQSQLEQPAGLLHLGFLQAHAVAFQGAEDLFNPSAQLVKSYDLLRLGRIGDSA
ncbi:MAG TPA: hypothetical protein VGC87_00365, partial [Pyrinomonadaceae bacterium]